MGQIGEDNLTQKQGPYGFYRELETEPKVKRAQLPKNISPEELSLDTALINIIAEMVYIQKQKK